MAGFSPEEIGKIADLASLELSDDEKATLAQQFEEILDYFRIIAAVDLGAAQAPAPTGEPPPLRDDKAVPSGISPADYSPYLENSHFKVPKVIE